eukprot:COSAG01_NODE_177_length_22954_cov_28.699554_16_plen_289_part_00
MAPRALRRSERCLPMRPSQRGFRRGGGADGVRVKPAIMSSAESTIPADWEGPQKMPRAPAKRRAGDEPPSARTKGEGGDGSSEMVSTARPQRSRALSKGKGKTHKRLSQSSGATNRRKSVTKGGRSRRKTGGVGFADTTEYQDGAGNISHEVELPLKSLERKDASARVDRKGPLKMGDLVCLKGVQKGEFVTTLQNPLLAASRLCALPAEEIIRPFALVAVFEMCAAADQEIAVGSNITFGMPLRLRHVGTGNWVVRNNIPSGQMPEHTLLLCSQLTVAVSTCADDRP